MRVFSSRFRYPLLALTLSAVFVFQYLVSISMFKVKKNSRIKLANCH